MLTSELPNVVSEPLRLISESESVDKYIFSRLSYKIHIILLPEENHYHSGCNIRNFHPAYVNLV